MHVHDQLNFNCCTAFCYSSTKRGLRCSRGDVATYYDSSLTCKLFCRLRIDPCYPYNSVRSQATLPPYGCGNLPDCDENAQSAFAVAASTQKCARPNDKRSEGCVALDGQRRRRR